MATTCLDGDYVFPFEYYGVDGEVLNGTAVGDSCVFPEAQCDVDLPAKGCCDFDPDFTRRVWSGYSGFVNFLPLACVFIIFADLKKSLSKEEQEAMEAEEKKRSQPRFITESRMPNWFKSVALFLWMWGFGMQIGAGVPVAIYMGLTKQSVMSAAQRTTLAAAEAFMTPYYTVFTFVEDIILVRVIYSITSGDKGLTDRLVHMGIAGVTVTGILGGIIGTILGVIPASIRTLTIPGQKNDYKLYPGCELIEAVDPSIVLPFWLMESWACWGMQIKNVLSGFMTGAEDYYALGWLGCLSIGMYSLTWFPFHTTVANPLTLIGIAEFIQDWSWPFILWMYLKTWGSEVCERTGLELSLTKVVRYLLVPLDMFRKSNEEDDESGDIKQEADAKNEISDTQRFKETKVLIKQGIALMLTDITLEGCQAATIYLALRADNAVAYQLTAMGSELPAFGLAGTFFAKMMLQVFGPMLLAIAHPKFFVKFVYMILASAVVVIGVAIGLAWPTLGDLAVISGKNACAFASSAECLPFFDKVMGANATGGTFTLFYTYYIFPVTIALAGSTMMFRGVLLTLLEFDYMLKCTLIAGVAFIPAICVVELAPLDFQQQAIAYQAAGLVPTVLLVFMFGIRSFIDLRKVGNGEEGSWTVKQHRRASVVMESQRLREKAITTANAEIMAANYKGQDDEKSA